MCWLTMGGCGGGGRDEGNNNDGGNGGADSDNDGGEYGSGDRCNVMMVVEAKIWAMEVCEIGRLLVAKIRKWLW